RLTADQVVLPHTYLFENGALTGERLTRTVQPLELDELFMPRKDKNKARSWSNIHGSHLIECKEGLGKRLVKNFIGSSILVLDLNDSYILTYELEQFPLPVRQA